MMSTLQQVHYELLNSMHTRWHGPKAQVSKIKNLLNSMHTRWHGQKAQVLALD